MEERRAVARPARPAACCGSRGRECSLLQLATSAPRRGPWRSGSSAEHGSSSRMTSGSTASARAMHKPLLLAAGEATCPGRRACPSPRPRARPGADTARRGRRDRARGGRSSGGPRARSPGCIMVGKGFGFWKTMPTRRRRQHRIDRAVVDVLPVEGHLPVTRAPGDDARACGSGSGGTSTCRSPRGR